MKRFSDSTAKEKSVNPSNRRDFIKHMPYLACYPIDPFKKLPDQLAYLLQNTIEPFFQISWNIKLLTGQVLNGFWDDEPHLQYLSLYSIKNSGCPYSEQSRTNGIGMSGCKRRNFVSA